MILIPSLKSSAGSVRMRPVRSNCPVNIPVYWEREEVLLGNVRWSFLFPNCHVSVFEIGNDKKN